MQIFCKPALAVHFANRLCRRASKALHGSGVAFSHLVCTSLIWLTHLEFQASSSACTTKSQFTPQVLGSCWQWNRLNLEGLRCVFFFVWSSCQFFYLCRGKGKGIGLEMIPTRATFWNRLNFHALPCSVFFSFWNWAELWSKEQWQYTSKKKQIHWSFTSQHIEGSFQHKY